MRLLMIKLNDENFRFRRGVDASKILDILTFWVYV